MDHTTAQLVDYAMSVNYSSLGTDTVRAAKIRFIDTLGCAIGAYHAPLSELARKLAYRYAGTPAATVLGDRQSSAEMAAFANGVMLRFLDLSDSYRVKSGGHPSDVIAAILAVAEATQASGEALIAAIATAYEVYCAFCEAIDINSKGWDQPVYGILGATLACGQLMRLNREQMGHAVALALAPNMAMHHARRGELSHWKGCAAANGSRNAVFAALLARDGFTGPPAIFEGKKALWDIVGRFEFPALNRASDRICRTHLKSFPVNYHGQAAVWAALELRDMAGISSTKNIDKIAAIHIDGYYSSVEEMASDPAHWAPKTHETADHSMPFVIASVLMDGGITADSFSRERLTDPRVARLMKATTVSEDTALTALFPESAPCRMTLRLHDSTSIESYVKSPKGHANNPFDDADLHRKFRALSRDCLDEKQGQAAFDALCALEAVRDTGDVMRLFSGLR